MYIDKNSAKNKISLKAFSRYKILRKIKAVSKYGLPDIGARPAVAS